MGSVKNLTVEKEPTETGLGLGIFTFTDDYSVFDYGKMPDPIPGKGEALARMSAFNFEGVGSLDIKNHFVSFSEPNRLAVKLVRVLYPGKDKIDQDTENYLIPLEIVFRNSLPAGSSMFRLLEAGKISPGDLGLDRMPKPGEKLPKPVFDFWTKLETLDRKLSEKEAMEIAGLSEEEFEIIRRTTFRINDFLNQRAAAAGLEHADGKVEFAMGPGREPILVDVFGTPDENRFLLNGFHISKQVLRDYYKTTAWGKEFDQKKFGPEEQWPVAPRAPPELITAVSDLYKAVAERWTGKRIWGVELESAVAKIRSLKV